MARSVRTCIGCRRKDDVEQLVRLVLALDNTLVVSSHRGARPGRGASLHVSAACARAAVAGDAFARAFRGARPRRADGRPLSAEELFDCCSQVVRVRLVPVVKTPNP